MKTFVKNFIGKGKQVAGMEIVKVTCKLEDLQNFAYEYNNTLYVTFEVAKMKHADNYGRDFTVYVNSQEEEKPATPAKASPKKKPKEHKNLNWNQSLVMTFLSKEKRALLSKAFFMVIILTHLLGG